MNVLVEIVTDGGQVLGSETGPANELATVAARAIERANKAQSIEDMLAGAETVSRTLRLSKAP